ncbi:hypothetical protein SCHPADRAFT_594219 [Schizopora paradoxa]|uniref:Secreted protein n=1 Tax=Schizopora paradoxa TaxID=27342 RepID=A0A0H2RAA3_9AGAM|nr:hypothetical protein SCHPADRAFT_594219 [Schizopora paradoxa]
MSRQSNASASASMLTLAYLCLPVSPTSKVLHPWIGEGRNFSPSLFYNNRRIQRSPRSATQQLHKRRPGRAQTVSSTPPCRASAVQARYARTSLLRSLDGIDNIDEARVFRILLISVRNTFSKP